MNPMYPIMFHIVPVIMCAILLVGLVRSMKEWHRNEQSPRLIVDAKVVSRRSAVRRTMSDRKHIHRHGGTNYYVTFQFETGDRLELEMSGAEYGMLAEGDQGRLTFQGSRYLGFERKI